MTLPSSYVDVIFTKLTLIFGRDFLGRWEGLDIEAVKADWAHELDGFSREDIKYALQNIAPTGKPPTVLEFRVLCRRAPVKELPALPRPKPTEEAKARVREALAEARRGIFIRRSG